jgi:hypothetical protein
MHHAGFTLAICTPRWRCSNLSINGEDQGRVSWSITIKSFQSATSYQLEQVVRANNPFPQFQKIDQHYKLNKYTLKHWWKYTKRKLSVLPVWQARNRAMRISHVGLHLTRDKRSWHYKLVFFFLDGLCIDHPPGPCSNILLKVQTCTGLQKVCWEFSMWESMNRWMVDELDKGYLQSSCWALAFILLGWAQ